MKPTIRNPPISAIRLVNGAVRFLAAVSVWPLTKIGLKRKRGFRARWVEERTFRPTSALAAPDPFKIFGERSLNDLFGLLGDLGKVCFAARVRNSKLSTGPQ